MGVRFTAYNLGVRLPWVFSSNNHARTVANLAMTADNFTLYVAAFLFRNRFIKSVHDT